MKKAFLSLAIVMVAALSANAQTSKGNWLVGGSASFATNSGNDFYKSTTFGIAPRAGYFFADNFAAGLNVSFTSTKPDGEDATSDFGVGPFVRYYFLPLGSNAKLFANGLFNYGSHKEPGTDAQSSTQWQISAGPAFFLNSHTALEVALAYGSLKPKDIDAINTFSVLVGFQIHLNGKK